MEYLQYALSKNSLTSTTLVLNLVISGIPSILLDRYLAGDCDGDSFKPCYKWNTFNTDLATEKTVEDDCFKPCYKWNTFNTRRRPWWQTRQRCVLNLVISGIPSILCNTVNNIFIALVLNLVISGIPSILVVEFVNGVKNFSFKPCYKWNTFNTR